MLIMVCCIVQSICACITSTCSRVGGGWRRVDILVVLSVVVPVVVVVVVPCVSHLKCKC
jgi:hypothetical protein